MKRPYPAEDKDDVPAIYGMETYAKPIEWLLEKCNTIEDWGCGYDDSLEVEIISG